MPREGKREKKKAFLSTWKIGQKREGGKREGEREGGEREREGERERGGEREREREGERGRERERGREILTIKSHYVRMVKHCHSISFSQYLRLLIRQFLRRFQKLESTLNGRFPTKRTINPLSDSTKSTST